MGVNIRRRKYYQHIHQMLPDLLNYYIYFGLVNYDILAIGGVDGYTQGPILYHPTWVVQEYQCKMNFYLIIKCGVKYYPRVPLID